MIFSDIGEDQAVEFTKKGIAQLCNFGNNALEISMREGYICIDKFR